MNLGLRIRSEADNDVDALTIHIAHDSPEQAAKFADSFGSTLKLIVESPSRWPIYGFKKARLSDLRKRSMIGFPNHLVFYRIDADMVEIVRVIHGHRDIPTIFGDDR